MDLPDCDSLSGKRAQQSDGLCSAQIDELKLVR